MTEKIGLRVGQTPGAGAKDGGQSSLGWLKLNILRLYRKFNHKKTEGIMKQRILRWTACFAVSLSAHAAVVAVFMLV